MKKYRLISILSGIFIIAGLALLLPFAYFWNQNRLAQANGINVVMIPETAPLPALAPDLMTGKPVRIIIDKIGLDMPVAEGVYDAASGEWTLTKNKAHYALPSIQPNNHQGNTFIYGHSYSNTFGRLYRIEAGSLATVITDNGLTFTYRYRDTKAVNPTNVDIFAYEGAPQLTLQTCSGVYLQNRQFYYFDFVKAEKSSQDIIVVK